MKINSLLLLLLFAGTIRVYGQVESEEVYYEKPEQEEELKDWSSGWHVGIESLRLLESASYTFHADDQLMYKQLYAFEAISYYQGRGRWRPTARLGYIWFEDRQDLHVARKHHRIIMSRGAYIKLGADIITRRKEKENHAVGIHSVLAYANEYYTFKVGNNFFGYREVFYRQSTWGHALELRYTYTQSISPKISYQMGGYVSLFERNSKMLLAYRNIPGITYSLGVFVHFLYKLRQ